jgi:predicted nucleotidyltransferase
MKLNVLTVFLLWGQFLFSQTFVEVPNNPLFDDVGQSAIAFSDVDGDGDVDVLITGDNNSGARISKLYINDGLGNFTEMLDTPFDGVRRGAIAFSDADGDGDEDVLLTGVNSSNDRIAKFYTNDGLGSFTEVLNTPFDGVFEGSTAFSDIDSDGDADVLITGLTNSNEKLTKLFTNDGLGNFTEVIGHPFESVWQSAIAFSDVNSDGAPDVLITGENNSSDNISKLYLNDGLGNFTEVLDTPFDGVTASSIAFSDVDSDGDEDVLIIGITNLGGKISKLYLNDGSGNFTEVLDTPFDSVVASSIAFSDVDNDGDEDVLIIGRLNSGALSSKLYINLGTGSFVEALDTPFEGLWLGSIAFSDVDGDGDEDVLITGVNNSNNPSSKLYVNDGLGNFTEDMGALFDGVWLGSIAFSDVDGDGDEDVLIMGETNSGGLISKLYTNDGLGSFIEEKDTPFDGIRSGSVAFSDIDSDGDSDVLIAGLTDSNELISKLYRNNGLGEFIEELNTPFEGVLASSIAFSDVNNDGDLDILITGRNFLGNRISKLYANDGLGIFTEVIGTPFDGVAASSIAFSDVDGDGDEDVLIMGETNSNELISKLYINDGLGSFTEQQDTPFDGVWFSSIAFSDVDGDGDPDLLITGGINSNDRISKLYKNNGLGNFTEELDTPFEDVWTGSVAFSDVDSDSDPDLLITGRNDSNELISKLYINDGLGGFTEQQDTPFDDVWLSSIAFSDVDGDGDPDLLITGENNWFERIAKLYINETVVSSIKDVASKNQVEFSLYPNPTTANNLNIRFDSRENGWVMIKIFDMNGRLLRQQKESFIVGQQNFAIDIADLVPGTYMIQLDDGKRRGVRNFLIQ